MLFKIYVALLISILTNIADASDNKSFLNLDFKHFTEEGFPTNWYIEGPENALFFKPSENDKYSIVIRSNEPTVLYVPLLTKDCIRSIELTMVFKAEATVDSAPIFIDPARGRPIIKPLLAGTEKDQLVTHSINFDKCAEYSPMLGFIVKGNGILNVQQFTLKVNDILYIDPTPLNLITEQDIKVAKLAAISTNGIDNSTNTPLDKAFSKWLSQVNVIGLGENSHGSSSLFEYKFDLIKSLIRTQGYTQFALEMPSINALLINDYINGKPVSETKLLHTLNYPSWQTQPMLDVIEFLKQENKSRTEKIKFVGIDIQNPTLTFTELRYRLLQIQAKRSVNLLELLNDRLRNGDIDYRFTAIELKQSLPNEGGYLKRFIDVLIEGHSLLLPTLALGSRSKLMAEQIILTSQNRKTIVWADNTHISKKGPEMGYYVARILGKEYFSVGLTFYQGLYAAYGPNNPYSANVAPTNSHEFLLNILKDNFILRLEDVPQTHPLHEVRAFRYIGSRPQTYSQFYPHRLSEHFDAIGFVKDSKAIGYLIEHQF